jgi:hypothetical protein
VSLGNVLALANATQREKLTFLEEEDKVGIGSLSGGAGPRLASAGPGRQTAECCGENIVAWPLSAM